MELVDRLEHFMTSNVAPILIDETIEKVIEDYSTIINASDEDEKIMCTYNNETGEKVLPNWLIDLNNSKDTEKSLLLIKDLNTVDPRTQLRFKEILKYRKINGVSLPNNTVIFVSFKDNSNGISDVISDLLIKYRN